MTAESNPVNRFAFQIVHVCKRHGAHRIRLFGSFADGTATETSDIDLLLTFSPASKEAPITDEYRRWRGKVIAAELKLLTGRNVDCVDAALVKPDGLKLGAVTEL